MKTANVNELIRQGDVLLVPVAELPKAAEVKTDRLGIRIAGERTGHAHQLVGAVAVAGEREFVKGGNVLSHQEHEHIATAPQWYEVIVQREHVPARAPQPRWD